MKPIDLVLGLLGMLLLNACNPCGDDPITELSFTITIQDSEGAAIDFNEQSASLVNELGFSGYVGCANSTQNCTTWILSGDDLLRETGHESGIAQTNTLYISYTDFTSDTIVLEQTASQDPECFTWEVSEGRVFFNDSLYYQGDWAALAFGDFVFRK